MVGKFQTEDVESALKFVEALCQVNSSSIGNIWGRDV